MGLCTAPLHSCSCEQVHHNGFSSAGGSDSQQRALAAKGRAGGRAFAQQYRQATPTHRLAPHAITNHASCPTASCCCPQAERLPEPPALERRRYFPASSIVAATATAEGAQMTRDYPRLPEIATPGG